MYGIVSGPFFKLHVEKEVLLNAVQGKSPHWDLAKNNQSIGTLLITEI